MMYSIGELSRLSGVTVRALRYYGSLGLLPAARVAETGYRYYDGESAQRLGRILFFRELGFSLEDVAALLDLPDEGRRELMKGQLELLRIKRERLDGLIGLLDEIVKGDKKMDFKAFDDTKLENAREKLAREVRERWGDTEAYAQSEKRESGRTDADKSELDKRMRELMDEFAALSKKAPPQSGEARALVERWQAFITDNYYECTVQILAGLGEMYAGDERFRRNIDMSGEGTAEFMAAAIAAYCG